MTNYKNELESTFQLLTGRLTDEQQELLNYLLTFHIEEQIAISTVIFYTPDIIREQMDELFFLKEHPETPGLLIRLIENAEKRSRNSALRSLDKAQEEIESQKDYDYFIDSIVPHKTRFIAESGTVLIIRGFKEMDGKDYAYAEQESAQGDCGLISIESLRLHYKRLD